MKRKLKDIMQTSDDMANQIELKFASNFNDLKEMSEMVRITGGASCSEVGLTVDGCVTERTTSTQY